MEFVVFALGLLVLMVIVPIWLLLHYVTRWRRNHALTTEDQRLLRELWQSADRLEARLDALETILDHDQPGWRRQS